MNETIKASFDDPSRVLRHRYLFVLALLGGVAILNQWLVHQSVHSQKQDGRVINIAGRQRMFSQKIAKTALQITSCEDPAKLPLIQNEMAEALENWEKSHLGLQAGIAELELPSIAVQEMSRKFQEIEPHFQAILAGATRLLEVTQSAAEDQSQERREATSLDSILANEAEYLRQMEDVLAMYEAAANSDQSQLHAIGLDFMAIMITVLCLTAFLIFEPAVKMIRDQLQAYEKEASAIASQRKLQELNSDLQADNKRRRQIEMLLLKQQHELKKLSLVASKTHHSVIIADPQGRIEWVNDGFKRLTGYSEAESIGRTPGELLQGPLTDRAVAQAVRESLIRQETVKAELVNYTKAGIPYWIALEVEPVFDEKGTLIQFIGTQTNITAKKEDSDALRNSEHQYRTLFESSRDAKLEWVNAQIVRCNSTAMEMFGCESDQELIEKTFVELSPPKQPCGIDSQTLAQEHIAQAVNKGSHFFEWVHCRTDGTNFECEILLCSLATNGENRFQSSIRDVTSRKETERALQESQERFDLAMQGSSDGVWDWNIETDEFYYSPRYWHILGHEDLEQDQIISSWVPLFHPDDQARVMAQVNKLLQGTGSNFESRFRMRHKEGHYVPILSRGVLLRDEEGQPQRMVGTHVDLTEWEQARQSLERFKTTLDQTHDCVFMFHAETLHFFYANLGATNQVGYSLSELQAMTPLDITPEVTSEQFEDMLRPLLAGDIEVLRFETVHQHKDGHQIPVEIALQYVSSEDQAARFVAVVRDISARRDIENNLRQAKEAAELANESKSQFLANMSHEIRTPLNGILGFTGVLLSDGIVTAEQHDYLQTIRSSGQHLLTLINDILDLSKIEAGKMEFESVCHSPHQVISDVLSVLRVRANEKQLKLECEWQGSIPETIQTDPARFRQLLMNLVGNAIKFTDRGYVRLVARVDFESDEPRFLIEVQDTGIGMKPESMEQIFEPFNQADSSITRDFGGTGLGLTICRHIVKGMGGILTAESEFGKGSVFQLRLPTGSLEGVRIFEKPPSEVLSRGHRDEDESGELPPSRILVVEDGETNQKLISLVLRRAGATVECVENGLLGLELASREQFDLILMDMQMPIMDGYSTTRRLRTAGVEIPIIALTAHAMRGDEEKCMKAGCDAYLTKPIDTRELIKIVGDHLAINRESQKQKFPPQAEAKDDPQLIVSSLPMDDEDFREIVEEFIETFHNKLGEARIASQHEDFEELARLAHWAKGAGGTAGFDCITEPAMSLETYSKEKQHGNIETAIQELESLAELLNVPTLSAS